MVAQLWCLRDNQKSPVELFSWKAPLLIRLPGGRDGWDVGIPGSDGILGRNFSLGAWGGAGLEFPGSVQGQVGALGQWDGISDRSQPKPFCDSLREEPWV